MAAGLFKRKSRMNEDELWEVTDITGERGIKGWLTSYGSTYIDCHGC